VIFNLTGGASRVNLTLGAIATAVGIGAALAACGESPNHP